MPEASSTETLQLGQRVRHRDVGGEGVMVQLDSGRVIVVNEVGLYIVQQLQQPKTRSALVAAITGEFAVDAAQAQADLEHYLDELGSENLLAAEPEA